MPNQAQDERRAAVDARFGAVEADVAWALEAVAGVKRSADTMLKATRLILEGFSQCQVLFQARVGGADKDWRKLKEEWPAAMGNDMKAHLGEGGPSRKWRSSRHGWAHRV